MKRFIPRLGDIGIALALCGLAVASALTLSTTLGELGLKIDARAYALIAFTTLIIAWRHRFPRLTLWTATLSWSTYVGLGYADGALIFALVIAIYSVALYVPRKQAYAHAGTAVGFILAWTTIGVFVTETTGWLSIAQLVIVLTIPFTLGIADSRRHARVTELELDAQRREHAERVASIDAVRAERARIARELHDVVAHEMTVMTLQAEGAKRRALKVDPSLAEALGTIADSGRKGLIEMQRMIGVLRTSEREALEEAAELTGRPTSGYLAGPADEDDLAPMPSLASIPALVRQVEDAGLPVHLTIAGTSHVPAGVELSAYRIIQESLTNALKYAGEGATATVTVRRKKDAVTVTIEDDGRGAISDVIATSGGHGIPGMRERVTSLGGTMETGPRKGGGFRVNAVLPVADDQVATGRARRAHDVRLRVEVKR